MRSEGIKNPMTPAGIEPATCRFVAQRLNQRATAVPQVSVCTMYLIKVKRGKQKCSEKKVPQWHCVEHKIHVGLNAVLQDENWTVK